MTDDIVFLDTETLGLGDAPIWEFAAIRRQPDGTETVRQFFIRHDPYPWLDDLPDEFANDYVARFNPREALTVEQAAWHIHLATAGAHIVGAVPNFDTERLAKLLACNDIKPGWHYHLIDVENLAVGYLAARNDLWKPPWKSDKLSAAISVDPQEFPRHTAMGDVLWVRAQYDAIMGTS